MVAPDATTGYHIKGTVTGSGGTSLANIYVEADSSDYQDYGWTASDGTYSVVVPAGSYTIWLSDPSGTYLDGYYSSGGFTVAEGSATTVTIGSSDVTGINVQMETGYHIKGTVTGSGGTSLANIYVEADSSDYDGSATTHGDGTYSVAVVRGSYKIQFNDPSNYYPTGYFSTHGFTVNAGLASSIVVTTADIAGIDVQLPAALSKLVVSGVTTPRTAGSTGSVRVTATDAYGNRVSSYLGTVHFTSTDAKAGLPANYTFTAADDGVHTFSVTLKTAGTQSVTATDTKTASIKGAQTGIVVKAAAVKTLVVSGLSSPRTAGTAGSLRVTATDAYGNRIHGYLGTVHFTSSDTKAKLPANYKFTVADAGTHVFSVTLKTAGMQSVTATDTTTSSIKGSQTGIVVK